MVLESESRASVTPGCTRGPLLSFLNMTLPSCPGWPQTWSAAQVGLELSSCFSLSNSCTTGLAKLLNCSIFSGFIVNRFIISNSKSTKITPVSFKNSSTQPIASLSGSTNHNLIHFSLYFYMSMYNLAVECVLF